MLDPLDAITISTDGVGGAQAGSATVVSNKPLGGVVRFQLTGIGIAGVGMSEPLTGCITPARRTPGGINTGIAIRNLSINELTLRVRLRQGGVDIGDTNIVIPAGGHRAKFINELFQGVANDFAGTLVIQIQDGSGLFSATALELGSNPGEFTTLPVTPLIPQ